MTKDSQTTDMTPKRHQGKLLKSEINRPAIRRIARRGGVKRLTTGVYSSARGVAKDHMSDVVRKAVIIASHAKRKTVSAQDVVLALKVQGNPIYGYGY